MKVPDVFFGNLKEVQSKNSKIHTILKKGNSIQYALEGSKLIDSNDFPDGLFWLDRAWSMQGGNNNFIFCEFLKKLMVEKNLEWEESNKIIDRCIDYLSTTIWGTLIINSTQSYWWSNLMPLNSGYRYTAWFPIVNGFFTFFEEINAEGSRYFRGASGAYTIDEMILQSAYVVANLDIKYCDYFKDDKYRFSKNRAQLLYNLIKNENILDKLKILRTTTAST